MYEVELKVRADHEPVRRALERLGAESLGAVEQVDTYYDAPHRDFAASDEALRVRRERESERPGTADDGREDGPDVDDAPAARSAGSPDRQARLTYKGPLVDDRSKTREEFETAVGDGDTADSILGGLGFEPAATVEKARERFRVGEYTVTLDAVDSLGEFVEVETEATQAELDAAREGARELLGDLGLGPESGIRTSYLGLLVEE